MFTRAHIIFLLILISTTGLSQDPLPAIIERDTVLTKEGSPHYVQQNLSINSGITLKINAGSQLIFSNGVSMSNNGRLVIEGSAADKVLFTSDSPDSRWKYITNQGSFYASHLMIRRAVRFISSYGDTVLIRNCDVAETYGGAGDDCIGVHYAKELLILNTRLEGNPDAGKTDAIDLDGISGDTISGNTIIGYSDDGIDIGTTSSAIVITNNLIDNCDMGVSIGESSTASVTGNLILNSYSGIQSHRQAVVYASQNTLYGNTHGIRALHNNGETGSGGTIHVSNSMITNCGLGALIELVDSEVHFEYNLADSALLEGTGNIMASPGFMEAINGDFHLSSDSDAIDAGNPDEDGDGLDYLEDVDDRDPDGTRLDIGCFPYYQSSVSFYEISPSNLSMEKDFYGEYSDWFILQNHSSEPFNLKGCYLSDNPDKPFKYKILEDLYLTADDTLRFWTDDKDDLTHMQLPFKLSGSGEALLLSSPTGVLMEKVMFPRVPINYVYRKDETSGTWIYSTRPIDDGTLSYDSISNDPVFGNTGGAETFPLTVSISSPDQTDSILYALDGSNPAAGDLYHAAIELQEPLTLRSVIKKEKHVPGYAHASTYFSGDSYQLPLVSLSTDSLNLYGSSGIYTHYSSSGPNWERPASFSYYGYEQQFSAIAGIRIQGGNSVFMPKKAFRLHFRGGYGTSSLEATPFDGGPSSFKNLVLRSGYDDDISTSTGTLLRDPFSTEIWKKLGELATESDFGVLLLNNNYWGIYNIRESINEYFVEDNMGIKDFDMVRFQKWGPDLKYGTMEEWNRMLTYFDTIDFTQAKVYDEVSTFMDLNSLLNLLSLVHCSQYRSWTWGTFAIKPKDGRWTFTIWDTDRSYDKSKLSWNGFTEYANTTQEKWPNFIPQKLVQNEQFRKELINRNCDLLNSIFVPETAISVYDSLAGILLPEMDAEFDRWNPGNRERWDLNNTNVRDFLRERPPYVYEQMLSYFTIDDTVRITLRIEGYGRVKLNSLVIDQESWTGTYMSGVPITLEAWPAEGERFIEWRGLSDLHRIEIDPAESQEIIAVFDTVSANNRDPVAINEIMYNPEYPEQSEWIELYNPNEHSVFLGGFTLSDGGADNLFVFPENAIIDSMGYYVVCGNSEQFITEFGANIYITGNFNSGDSGFKLSNEGESLFLKRSNAELEDYVRYSNTTPWPEEPDGQGPSLQLLSPALDNNDYNSWYASNEVLCTPGRPNGGSSVEEKSLFPEYDIHVYPNPMGSTLYLNVQEEPGSEFQLMIFDLSGSMVARTNHYAGGGKETFSWKHGIQRPGAYILQVSVTGNSRYTGNSHLLIYSGDQ